jgi:hypothetical protein
MTRLNTEYLNIGINKTIYVDNDELREALGVSLDNQRTQGFFDYRWTVEEELEIDRLALEAGIYIPCDVQLLTANTDKCVAHNDPLPVIETDDEIIEIDHSFVPIMDLLNHAY